MRTLLVAIHGIMTNQTDPSWPDELDAWMFDHDPEIKVIKKEYRAGPFPHWNCQVKDPAIARSLANELELFLRPRFHALASILSLRGDDEVPVDEIPALWFVAHSNGAVIALLTAKILIERGYRIAGMILTGAACEAEITKNHILEWLDKGVLGAAIAYSSDDDQVLAGDPEFAINHQRSTINWLRQRVWGALMKPYGCLGSTGFLLNGERVSSSLATLELHPAIIGNRWYSGGHSTYFKPRNRKATFGQILADITTCNRHLYDATPNPLRCPRLI